MSSPPIPSLSQTNLRNLTQETEDEEGYVPTMATYPPQLLDAQILGYITDTNGIGYSRDVGFSFLFNGVHYFMFGDTFCFDKQGHFVGITSNTVAEVGIQSPIQPSYWNIEPDGLVQPFIPLNGWEEHKEKTEGIRTAHWCFGGIAEVQPGMGWVFYQHYEIYQREKPSKMVFKGTGLAELSVNRFSNKIQAARNGNTPLFGPDEPRIGSMCTLVERGFIYLYSHMGEKVILSRVSTSRAHRKSDYRFWIGNCYGLSSEDAIDVLPDMQQGQVIHSDLFGRHKCYIFVGCSRFADSQIIMGFSSSLVGPFTFLSIAKAIGIDHPFKYMYCMYPHPWALRGTQENRGDLLVTWSEHWPGGVVAAKLKFQISDGYHFYKIPLNRHSALVRAVVMPNNPRVQEIARQANVSLQVEGRFVREGMQLPPGEVPIALVVKGLKQNDVSIAVWHIKGILKDFSESERQGARKVGDDGRGTIVRVDGDEQTVDAAILANSNLPPKPSAPTRLRRAISNVFLRRQSDGAKDGMGRDGAADTRRIGADGRDPTVMEEDEDVAPIKEEPVSRID